MRVIPGNVLNFMLWIRKYTTHIQANVVRYKGKMYFTDRAVGDHTDGGLNDLWIIYVKETIG